MPAVVPSAPEPFPAFPGHVALLSFAAHDGGRGRRRAVEHARGRAAAGVALGYLGGAALASAPVGSDAEGCPVWPVGVVGSISHSAPFAAAAVGWAWTRSPHGPNGDGTPLGESDGGGRGAIRGVGVDVESIRSRHAALWDRVVLPEDADAAPPGAPAGLVATVCFAIREAVYKCVYPALRAPMDWSDARLTADWVRGQSAVALHERFGVEGSVSAAFQLLDTAVLAVCWWNKGSGSISVQENSKNFRF